MFWSGYHVLIFRSFYTFSRMIEVQEIVVVCDPSYKDIFEGFNLSPLCQRIIIMIMIVIILFPCCSCTMHFFLLMFGPLLFTL